MKRLNAQKIEDLKNAIRKGERTQSEIAQDLKLHLSTVGYARRTRKVKPKIGKGLIGRIAHLVEQRIIARLS